MQGFLPTKNNSGSTLHNFVNASQPKSERIQRKKHRIRMKSSFFTPSTTQVKHVLQQSKNLKMDTMLQPQKIPKKGNKYLGMAAS